MPTKSEFKVSSDSIEDGKTIPVKYTADGEDVSPALAWKGVPEGVVSFAVICADPDAPSRTWHHWGLYNIPGTAGGLPEAVPAGRQVPGGMRQAVNDFGRNEYGGPAPPRGKPHRYVFRVYALDTLLDLRTDTAPVSALTKAVEGHVLAEGTLTGTYQR